MTPNITTLPMATNAGPKPFIKASGVGYTVGTAAVPTAVNSTPTTILSAPFEATEGNWVYGVFKFQKSNTDTTAVELRDSVAVTYTFDGISSEDWDHGTFKIAALDASGAVMTDAPSDWYDAGYSNPTTSASGWSNVSTDSSAMSGTLYYQDQTPFNPFSGTSVYGVVLAVKVKTDSLVESGEFVKFKVTQDTASGTAFTQSNYTEATINIKDFLGANGAAGVTVGMTGRFDTTASIPYIRTDEGSAPVTGTDDVIDTFKVGGGAGSAVYSESIWNIAQATATNNLISHHYVINNFDREDVMVIDFKGSKPGLSLTTINAESAGFANEAFFLNALRSVNGYQVNNGGVYLFEVNNSVQYVNASSNAAQNGTGVSTYVFIDTNRNGLADTIDTDISTTTRSEGDLLIRLSGVSVGDIQSTNFSFIAS